MRRVECVILQHDRANRDISRCIRDISDDCFSRFAQSLILHVSSAIHLNTMHIYFTSDLHGIFFLFLFFSEII